MADAAPEARGAHAALTPTSGAAVLTVATLLLWHWLRRRQRLSKNGLECTDCSAPQRRRSSGKRVGGSASQHDAAACWALGHGRYKHCGLREDPLASTELPVFSPTNVDIPLLDMDLSAERKAQLELLSRQVADLTELANRGPGCGGHRTDRSTLERFLRSVNWNVKRAEKQLRAAASWRQQCDVDRIFTHWDLEAYERCLAPWWLSGGYLGCGKDGQPVALERIGRCRFPDIVKAIPWEVLLRIDLVFCMRCLGAMEEYALRRGAPVIPALVVMDVQGFGLDQAEFQAARAIGRLVESRTKLLAECTGKVLIIRAPAVFTKAWNTFKYLLEPGTRAKVEVVSGDESSLQVLREYLDDDVIPEYLGGKFCLDGDPECSVQLAPGGPPPKQAIDRLLELTVRDGDVLPAATEANDSPCRRRSGPTRRRSSFSTGGDAESTLDQDAKPRRYACCGL